MYTDFYHLKKEPFRSTPDPEFLFLSPSHTEALASIIYGVEQRKGLIVTIGDVGVGKTTVLQSYLRRVDKEQLKCIYIFNSNTSFEDLLKTIFQELGSTVGTDNMFDMVNLLHRELMKEHEHNRGVVLVIDEAENMPIDTLKKLCILSNLETSDDKLIQMVLAGQPEFDQILDQNELRQFRQRIAIRTTILPLTKEESLAYIRHRLLKAAADVDNLSIFTKGALKKIVGKARGIPRSLNILCDNALITAFGYQKNPVDSKIVKEVITDLKLERKNPFLRLKYAFPSLILLIFALFMIFQFKDRFPIFQSDRITGQTKGRKNYTVPATSINRGPRLTARKAIPGASQNAYPVTRIVMAKPVSPKENHTEIRIARPVLPKMNSSAKRITRPESPEKNLDVNRRVKPKFPPPKPSVARISEPESTKKDIHVINEVKPEPPGKTPSVATGIKPEPPGKTPSVVTGIKPKSHKDTFPVIRIIKKGDNLYRLTLNVYSFSNNKLIEWVKQNNPGIKDITRIKVGDKIVFPELDDTFKAYSSN